MKKIIALLLLVTIPLGAIGQGRDVKFKDLKKDNPTFAASALYANGVNAKLLGYPKEALALFNEVLKLNPNHAPAYYQLASLTGRTDLKLMTGYARKAYNLDPTNYDFLLIHVTTLIDSGNYTEASNLLSELSQSGAHTKKNAYLSVALASQLADNDAVIVLANSYTEKWGFNPSIIDMLAQSMIAKRKYVAAEDLLESYVDMYPSESGLRISLAKIKAAMFKDDQAVALFESAIELDPMDFQSHLALADYYLAKKEIAKYLVALRPVFESRFLDSHIKADYFEHHFFDISIIKDNFLAIQQIAMSMYASDPMNPEVEKIYTRFLMYTGDTNTAKYIIRKLIEEGRADQDNFMYIIQIDSYLKNKDSVLYYARLGEKQFPKSVDFPMMIAYSHFEDDNFAGALSELSKAYKLAANDSIKSSLLTFEGDIYHKANNNKKAFAAYDKALKLKGDNAGLLNNYAYYLSLEGKRLDDALRMSQRANELDSGNSTFLDTQAWVLYQLGRYEEARTVQRRAIALVKEPSEDMLSHYGDILFKVGENFLAETFWKQALDAGADKEVIQKKIGTAKIADPTIMDIL